MTTSLYRVDVRPHGRGYAWRVLGPLPGDIRAGFTAYELGHGYARFRRSAEARARRCLRRQSVARLRHITDPKSFDRYRAERAEVALARVRALQADRGDFRLCNACAAEVDLALKGDAAS